MILDKRENACNYLGISKGLDAALRFLKELAPERLAVNVREEIMGPDVFYTVGEPVLTQRPMTFEFHRKYADIHAPITGKEIIALCPASDRPSDTPFDEKKDVGFFDGNAVNVVEVPAGWFCLCFPEDAHVPCIGPEERAIVKAVVKVRV